MSSNRFESIADLIEGEAKKEKTDEDLREALNNLDWNAPRQEATEDDYDPPISSIDFSSGTVTVNTGRISELNMNMAELGALYSQTEDPRVLRTLVRAYDSEGSPLRFSATPFLNGSTISATVTPPITRGEQIWQTGRSSTNRSDPAVILTYVVPARKSLYLQSYQVQALTQSDIDALITLRVASVSIDRMRCSGIDVQTRSFGEGIMLGQAGDSLSIEIAPRRAVTTEWSVSFLGFLVDTL